MEPFSIPCHLPTWAATFHIQGLTQCVLYFHYMLKQCYCCQCLGFLTCTQMLMHTIAQGGCMNTTTLRLREFALKVNWEKNPLPQKHAGPDAQPAELHPYPTVVTNVFSYSYIKRWTHAQHLKRCAHAQQSQQCSLITEVIVHLCLCLIIELKRTPKQLIA